MTSPPQSEFPTLAEMLARGSEEPPAAAPIVAVVEGRSEATDVERSLPAGSVVAIVSTTAIEVSGQGHHAATLAGLTELVRSNVGDILFVSGEARPTRSEVSGLTRSLASDSACTTVSLDGRSRPAVPGLPPPAVDTPRGGVVLVRRDDLLLAADEADLSSCFGERSPVAGWGPLVGSVLALLERPGFVHRASGGVSEAVDDAQGSPAPPRRKATARILVDGSFLAHRLAGTQVQALALVRALVRTGADLAVLRPREIHPTVAPSLDELVAQIPVLEREQVGTAGRRAPDVADLLPPRARRPPRDRRAVRAHPPGHDLGPDTGVPRRRREARLPSRHHRDARARRPRGVLLAPRGQRRRERRWARARSRDGRPARRRPSRRPRRPRLSRPTPRRQALPADGRQLVPAQEPGLRLSPPRAARRPRLGGRARPRRRGERVGVVGAGGASVRRRQSGAQRSRALARPCRGRRATRALPRRRARPLSLPLRRIRVHPVRGGSPRDCVRLHAPLVDGRAPARGGGSFLVRRRRGRRAGAPAARAARRACADRRRDLGEGCDADLGADGRRVPGGLRAGPRAASTSVCRRAPRGARAGDQGRPEPPRSPVARRLPAPPRKPTRRRLDLSFGDRRRAAECGRSGVDPTRAPSRRGSGRASARP